MRPIPAVLVLSLALGCGDSTRRLAIGFPSAPGAQSEVIAVRHSGATTFFAYPIGEGPAELGANIPFGTPVELHAIVFSETLQELGLSQGVLQSASADQEHHRLRTPLASFGLNLTGNELTGAVDASWIAEEKSALFNELRIQGPDTRCVQLQTRPTEVVSDVQAPRFVTRLEDGSALVTLRETAVSFRVTATDWTELSHSPRREPKAAFTDDRGLLWLAGDDQLWQARVHTSSVTFEVIHRADFSNPISMDGGYVDGQIELVMLHNNGMVSRYRDGAFDRHDVFVNNTNEGGIAWIGPHHAIVGWATQPQPVELKDGQIRLLQAPAADGGFTSARRLRDGRVVLGTANGGLAVGDENGFDILSDAQLVGGIGTTSILEFGPGVVYGGGIGPTQQYILDGGACEEVPAFRHRADFVFAFSESEIAYFGPMIAEAQTRITRMSVVP